MSLDNVNETEMLTGIWPTGLYTITSHNVLFYLFAWSLFHVFIRQAWASRSKMPSVFSDRATFLPHSLQISIVEKLDRDV